MRLRIVHDERGVYAEFDPDDFRKVLINEYAICRDVGRAFDRVCDRLKEIAMRI